MRGEARDSLVAAVSAVFGALSAVLAVLPLSFPFPVIPYLKFDLAEIPVVLAFLGFGPLPGAVSALTYWGVLTLVGEFTPIGPLMKFLALGSMLLGLWVGLRAGSALTGSCKAGISLGFAAGSVLRVLTMTAANYVVLLILFPEFLALGAQMLSASLGVSYADPIAAFPAIMAFTAIFNVLHVALSFPPSLILLNCMTRDGLFLNLGRPWLYNMTRKFKVA